MTKFLIVLFLQDPSLTHRLMAWLRRAFLKNRKSRLSVPPQDRYEEWVDKQW